MKKLNIIQKIYYRTKIFFTNLFRWGSCGSDISDIIQRLYKKGHYAELHEFYSTCKNQNIDPIKFLKCAIGNSQCLIKFKELSAKFIVV